jgi:hypothetical protein
MALFLASDESEWITGQAICVDGGLTAGRTTLFETPEQERVFANRYLGPSFTTGRSSPEQVQPKSLAIHQKHRCYLGRTLREQHRARR